MLLRLTSILALLSIYDQEDCLINLGTEGHLLHLLPGNFFYCDHSVYPASLEVRDYRGRDPGPKRVALGFQTLFLECDRGLAVRVESQ